MFRISHSPLQDLDLPAEFEDPCGGAVVTFEGRVRNHHEGRQVVGLEYEAYEDLACREGLKIIEESTARFDALQARCVHRVGRLEIGHLAVCVVVLAAHREAAFRACEYIIDQIKLRVPIWKKEYYADGDSGWVNCACADHARQPQPAARHDA